MVWKMLAVMPSVICSIRRSDFAVNTEDCRNGVLRKIDTTRSLELFVCSPAAQRELLEPAGKLHVAADGFPRLVDAEANE